MRTPESSRASPWSWVVSTVLIPSTQSLAQLNMLSLLGGLVTIYASPALFVLRSGVIDNENVVKGERRSSLAPHSLALRSY